MPLQKIISGGQTGVDRAALDAALKSGIACGGWCPKGRRSEDGVIPARYPLQEMESAEYPIRTERNVMEGDATLILIDKEPDRGTALTKALCSKHKKPFLIVDLHGYLPDADENTAFPGVKTIVRWIENNNLPVLNVAGNRESYSPGIGQKAEKLLSRIFSAMGS